MEAVKQKSHKLLRILLLVARKLWREPPDARLELSRRDDAVAARPHLMHQAGVGIRDLPAHAKRILHVQLVFITIIHKEFCQRNAVAETLEGGVHETGIAKVRETTQARTARRLAGIVLVVITRIRRRGIRAGEKNGEVTKQIGQKKLQRMLIQKYARKSLQTSTLRRDHYFWQGLVSRGWVDRKVSR